MKSQTAPQAVALKPAVFAALLVVVDRATHSHMTVGAVTELIAVRSRESFLEIGEGTHSNSSHCDKHVVAQGTRHTEEP